VIYQGRWKLLIEPGWYRMTNREPGIQYELYDLEADPAEKQDVSLEHPERVAQLAQACAAWQEESGIVDYAQILELRPNHTK